jgi:hypothetical protein
MNRALERKGECPDESSDDARLRDRPGGVDALFRQALDRLGGQAGPPADALQAPNLPNVRGSEAVASARCDELVDRILASTPAADGSAEVRITIDKPWLPDTEVRLTLTADALLDVDFRTDSVEAQRFLLPNLESLRERLAEKNGFGIAVRMTEGSRGNGGDGRSRNRREAIYELDEE